MLGFFMLYTFRYSFVADHYQYLACVGPIALVSAGMDRLRERSMKGHPLAARGLCAILLAVLGILTWRQSETYGDLETLWSTTVARNPESWLACNNLGHTMFQQGRTEEAVAQFDQALRIHPDQAEAHYNLGVALAQQGRAQEAIAEYREALRIDPTDIFAHNNLGNALFYQGRTKDAIAEFREAVRIDPDYENAHNNLGNALCQEGLIDDAIDQYRQALRIDPAYADALFDLANALFQQGHAGEAIADAQAALELQPANPAVQNDLAWMLAAASPTSLRNGDKAVQLAIQATQASGGDNPVVLRTLAAAYAQAGQFKTAVQAAQKALQLAQADSNTALAAALSREIKLYEAERPL